MAADRSTGLEPRRRRNSVLRALVEVSLREPDLSFESLMEMLEGYRANALLSPADELWAIARQAELRFEADYAKLGVDRLLVDMRRFEPKLQDSPELNRCVLPGWYRVLPSSRARVGPHLHHRCRGPGARLAELFPVCGSDHPERWQ